MATTIYTSLVFLLVLPFFSPSTCSTADQDRSTLLSLKSHWNNPIPLSSWSNSTSTPHCSWLGITCNPSGAVTAITLRSLDILGDVPSFLCQITTLTILDLYNNSLYGPLPPSLSQCADLLHLDLSQNYLNGSLPSNLSAALPTSLQILNLGGNEIVGEIPAAIGQFPSLQSLYLDNNYFTNVPSQIGSLTHLQVLTLANNPFAPGPLPREFTALTNLTYLWASQANLTGSIPDWIGSCRLLNHLDLSMNGLTGTIPSAVWGLSNLTELYLYKNRLSGGIPAQISALELKEIDVSMNYLNGSIPEAFGQLQKLKLLYMYSNNLTGAIPASISRIKTLIDIRLFRNQLTGTIPSDLGKYSYLWNFEITQNRITGGLPETLCAKGQLSYISTYSNELSGNVPEALGNCSNLRSIRLHFNRLSGEFPARIWTLPNLNTLLLNGNDLSGELPAKLPWNLTRLDISDNKFAGWIPTSAPRLLVFHASSNAFSGSLPTDLSGISNLQELLLAGNMVSGEIPLSIGVLKSLTSLNLSRNQLTGPIPDSIGSLNVLNYLDLSNNHLSGEIPASFDNLKLNKLNLSYNSFTGPIPVSLQIAAYDRSFLGNPGLCSVSNAPLLNLATCSSRTKSSGELSKGLVVLVVVLAVMATLVATVFGFFAIRDLRRRQCGHHIKWKVTSFQYLNNISEVQVTKQLVPQNRVGSGGAGEVYRVALGNGMGVVVAVKRIWNSKKMNSRLQKEFLAEVDILGSIRHTNIVKLLCCISSESDNSKLLVYEYMENGSLYEWLHTKRREGGLDWPTRVEIAVGAARGLCYMHHDCQPPVVHWDVKSSNILIDKDLKPKVADFGLARIMANGIGEATSVSTVAGSFGYMAPECAYSSRVNEKVDVYSFGVVLLELTTGRKAHEGGRDCSLAQWVRAHFNKGGSVIDVVDEEIKNSWWMEEITSVVRLALLCTGTLPSTRPTMKDVLNVLLRCVSAHRNAADKDGGEIEDQDVMMNRAKGRSKRAGDEDKESLILLEL